MCPATTSPPPASRPSWRMVFSMAGGSPTVAAIGSVAGDLPVASRNARNSPREPEISLGQPPQLLGSKPPCSWVKPPRLRTTRASGCGRVRGVRASPTGDKRLCVRARNSRSPASSSLHPQCPDEVRCAVALLLACAATICLRICRSPMR
jgi:hypothetical protein